MLPGLLYRGFVFQLLAFTLKTIFSASRLPDASRTFLIYFAWIRKKYSFAV